MKLFPYAVFIVGYYLVRMLVLLPQSNRFYISFLNVGQGDSFVINIPSYGQVLIDTGPDYQSNYLSARTSVFPVCNIKSIFITHYDSDHAGGLERIGKFCHNITIYDSLKYGDVVSYGATKMYVLSPPDRNPLRDINDNSLVLLLKYQDFEALLTGDAGLSMLESVSTIIDDYKSRGIILGALDVYKVAHHGSRYNSSKDLIDALKPARCIISVGKNNYGHPSKEVIQDLADSGCLVQRTDKDGTITFYSVGVIY